MSLNRINQINVYELQDLPRNQINVFLIKQIIYLQFIYIYIEHIFDGLLSFTKNCEHVGYKKDFFILNLSHYRFPVKTLAVRTVGQKI